MKRRRTTAQRRNEPHFRWYDVPAGTPQRSCDGCLQPIFWITTPNGKRMPVDCDTVEGSHLPSVATSTTQSPGRGVSHFQTCSKADRFSKRGRGA